MQLEEFFEFEQGDESIVEGFFEALRLFLRFGLLPEKTLEGLYNGVLDPTQQEMTERAMYLTTQFHLDMMTGKSMLHEDLEGFRSESRYILRNMATSNPDSEELAHTLINLLSVAEGKE